MTGGSTGQNSSLPLQEGDATGWPADGSPRFTIPAIAHYHTVSNPHSNGRLSGAGTGSPIPRPAAPLIDLTRQAHATSTTGARRATQRNACKHAHSTFQPIADTVAAAATSSSMRPGRAPTGLPGSSGGGAALPPLPLLLLLLLGCLSQRASAGINCYMSANTTWAVVDVFNASADPRNVPFQSCYVMGAHSGQRPQYHVSGVVVAADH